MKKYLRSYLIALAALTVSARLIGTLVFMEGEKTLLVTGLALVIVNIIVKPIINLLLLPVNLLTLGLFRWLVNVFAFYIVLMFVPTLEVKPFTFPGFENGGFIFPEVQFSFFWTLFLICFIISFVTGFLYWAFKK
ncbi:phage holin family protein [Patescibacteria group bacterium]